MKITFILSEITIAGGIKSTFELANRLQDKGHEVSVVYPLMRMREGAKWYDIRSLAGRIAGMILNLKRGNNVNWFDLKPNLIRVPVLSERWIPDGDIIVATWWANAYDVNRYHSAKGEKFYFVRHYETWGGPEDLVNKTYTLPLHLIVTSTWLKNLLEGKFNVSTYGPLPNGIDSNYFYKERDGFECHNPRRVGIMYRRNKWKGMKDGLEALFTVKKRFPDIKIVLFGEDPDAEDQNIIEKIDNVEFYHLPYKEKLREIYNSLDIFVFPSHHEGFGNPPMEAMACGVACVTTGVGAVPDYTLPGKTALVSPAKDPESLAGNIVKLVENEEERKRMAEEGYDHIHQFTWEKTAEKLEEIFRNHMNEKN